MAFHQSLQHLSPATVALFEDLSLGQRAQGTVARRRHYATCNIPWPGLSGTHQETGCRYAGEMLRTRFDHLNQVRRDLWRYTELAPNGAALAQDTREMALLELSLGASPSPYALCLPA